MVESWEESVKEHEETLRKIAENDDLPLSEDCQELLEDAGLVEGS